MVLLDKNLQEFDFIVVGGGTAGCAVAGRLAENPNVTVLVVEAGVGNPKDIPEITTPARAFSLRGSKHDWGYKTTMIDRPEYTRIEKPNTRGKVLGGSSCLNYYTWLPGSAATFDAWTEFGGEDWNWENCREYFRKPATYHDDDNQWTAELKTVGTTGPIHVSHGQLAKETEDFRGALKAAWTSKGGVLADNVYDGKMGGLIECLSTIYNGVRSSSWSYLEGKENAIVMAETTYKKVIIEDGKAVGVEVTGPDGKDHSFRAKHEVIASCGVFETPKLLMLSGIGPSKTLNEFGIKQAVDSPHVGQNLLDHPILAHVFKLKDGYGLDHHLLRSGYEHDGAVAAYRNNRTGPYSSGLLELVGLPRIDDRLKKYKEYNDYVAANGGLDPFGPGGQPHFEIDFVPMFCDAFQWHFPTPPQGDYLTVIVDLLRPLSKNGTVTLNSADPQAPPSVNINFFSNDLDILALREGVRWVDDLLLNGEGTRDIVGDDYPWPMPRTSDEAMKRTILERSQTGFHPCGTCRMSKNIEQGVVDNQLRVHGVQGLRVIDASVIPVIPDCRIQNAVYMIAEKGADLIKAAHPELYRT
ncbi:hypothetical protein BX600DRAFT_67027 [Xylariales sp. PMI_506]|nr:hypothetical protein BX600DRAFT_67027 [Xylariales sp. PMI_506]